jgi:hypothetical protein
MDENNLISALQARMPPFSRLLGIKFLRLRPSE